MLNNPSILVCTDFKLPSDFALKSAEVIRTKAGGKVHAVHFSDMPAQWDWVARESRSMIESDKMDLTLLRSLREIMKEQVRRCEVSATSHVSFGPIYDGIMDTIASLKPDLVVMGHTLQSHGLLSLGGIVSKVVASSKVPVLVTKKILEYPAGKVAGLINTEDSITPIISATEELSFLLSAEPEVISLLKNLSLLDSTQVERSTIMGRMRDEISKSLDPHSKCKIKVEITEERQVAYHLAKILDRDLVDLVIMKRHQKGLIEKMLIGSVTRRMLEIFNGNILVLPPST